jgi:hypothetical protein
MILSFFLVQITGMAQDIRLELGPDEIGSNEYFTITVTVNNDRIRSYDKFPEIEGFYKQGTSSSSSTNIVNGRASSTYSITQNYLPAAQGNFRLKPFTMVVNEQKIRSQGKPIKVGPPIQRRQRYYDPFEDFFGRRQEPRKQEYIDIEDDAFVGLTVDKEEVFIGEPFLFTFAFYVAETNRAPLQFYDVGNQVIDIMKEIKPANCWEENFNIESIEGVRVNINGKYYTQYKLFQATYYPFNLDTIRFPSVDFKMIKYKTAKNYSFFGQNRKEDYKIYKSKPSAIVVKELPDHPLKNKVSVGNFMLSEKISDEELTTGSSFDYRFSVYGEGNISAISEPILPETRVMDIYPPNIKMDIRRGNGMVRGQKAFDYFILPNEPGTYELGDYFQWIFFNTEKGQYDTLRSEIVVEAIGESKKNVEILSNDLGSFYDRISFEKNQLKNRNEANWVKILINFLLVSIFGASIYVLVKK